jgi:hypothetical protein
MKHIMNQHYLDTIKLLHKIQNQCMKDELQQITDNLKYEKDR